MPARYILGIRDNVLLAASARLVLAYALFALLSNDPRPALFSLRYLTLLALLSAPAFSLLHPLTLLALFPSAPLSARLLGATISALLSWRRYLPEPYGLFHVELNEREAEWMNMGLSGEGGFERAAERMALRVIEAGRCRPGGKVLDVGHGTGDSLLLHLSHPTVPRPSLLAGITSVPIQHARASSRCLRDLEKLPGVRPTLKLFCGDAISRPPSFAPVIWGHWEGKSHEHPLYWDSSFPLFDSILSIDSAFHYEPRERFFQQAFRRLAPGGMLALGDVCFHLPPTIGLGQALTRAAIAALMDVPAVNIISLPQYVNQLQRIGFADVQVEEVTERVFPGCAAHLARQRGVAWKAFAPVIRLWMWAGARFVIVSARKPAGMALPAERRTGKQEELGVGMEDEA
ncbi:S-adenosyl-L-methionine-dependent methyltransferase [Calocera viscosa TUFC12733]|uniref:phosphoethanolamine N-methyltransferase n=1 Tax=Calocera viscosa (strain TUFC12733) TaxID=1330018 RepID=A0A167RJ44_CALVF|nr:S-adenosyl-L-methionine-dependent methyltransferase [Calocera viscosa TUFC12733]